MLRNARKLTCHRGHPLSGDNLSGNTRGKRACKACMRGHQRRRAGWPEDMAYSLPAQKLGYKPEGLGTLWHEVRMTPKPKRTELERFMVNVDIAPGCWHWHGPMNETGYGRFYFRGKNWKAHRVAYELMIGQIPPSDYSVHGTMILHSCDNPRCVNPLHLKIGNAATNMIDAQAKGRLRGNGRNKLDAEKVRSIRERIQSGVPQKDIAAEFGIVTATVSSIATRKIWKSVP